MNQTRNVVTRFFVKVNDGIKLMKARRRERLAVFKERQEMKERGIKAIAWALADGDFENAEKQLKELSSNDKVSKKVAKKALVFAIRNRNKNIVEKIITKYYLTYHEVYFAAVEAWEKSMADKYYSDAMNISKEFGLKGRYEEEPVVRLIKKYLMHGQNDEAMKLARENDLEKQLQKFLREGN